MKLESPLKDLAARCQTICVAECCGIDAYDFSPIHIASYLTMSRGFSDENEVETILEQLATLQKRAHVNGVTIDEMNQIFTPEAANDLVKEITLNIKVALDLIQQSEFRRMRRASR